MDNTAVSALDSIKFKASAVIIYTLYEKNSPCGDRE
jgi:hypothetical protein